MLLSWPHCADLSIHGHILANRHVMMHGSVLTTVLHARSCGQVVSDQSRACRYLLNKQSRGTTTHHADLRPLVLQPPGVVAQDIDQCRLISCARNGRLVKIPTLSLASHPALVAYLRNLSFDGSHKHQQLTEGNYAYDAQQRTWDFAAFAASGVTLLRKVLAKSCISVKPRLSFRCRWW